ncbi:MAG: STAS domain-containing protein [Spirochaetes bacterium]|nr:STAS domain-containing protein [Spirochaetota bacterium]
MISVSNDNGFVITILDKSVNINNADILRDDIKKTVSASSAKEIAIDLVNVDFLDSSAIAMLVKLVQSLAGSKKKMSIINVAPIIRNTIKTLNLTKFLNIM